MSGKRNALLDKVALLAAKGFTRACQLAPRSLAMAAGSMVGGLFWAVLRLERKRIAITLDNLRILYPGQDDARLRPLARRTARHFGRFLAESARAPLLTRGSLGDLVTFEGLEHYAAAHAQGKGVILATAHFGNFELAACAQALMGYPVYSVIREVDNPGLDVFMDQVRGSSGLGVIKKERAARDILGHIRRGDTVTVHIDLNASFNLIYVPFFGRYASTFTTPAVMSLRTGAPLLTMLSFRDDAADRYHVKIYPPAQIAPAGNRNADVRQIIMALNGGLEEAIRQAPEQWFWFHRRWKKEPTAAEMAGIEKELEAIKAAQKGAGGAG